MTQLDPIFVNELKNIDNILKNEIIKNILDGTEINFKIDHYLSIYNFVSKYGNRDIEASHLYEYFNNTLKETFEELSKNLKDKQNNEIIDLFIDFAKKIDIIISFMYNTFSYLEYYYVRNFNKEKILKCALEIYKKYIFLPIQKQVTDEVNKLLKEDRLGKKEYFQKIKKILSIMKTMDLSSPAILKNEKKELVWIEKDSEKKNTSIQKYWFDLFLKDTEEFLIAKIKEDLQKNSIPEFITIQLKFLEEEKERQKEVINEIFIKELNELIYKKIIEDNMKEIIEKESGLKDMLKNNKNEELTNLYELFKLHEPSLKELAKIFVEYVENRGKLLSESEEIKAKPESYPQCLNELQKEINSIVENCFKNNEIILSAVKVKFGELMNPGENNSK